MSIVQKCMAIMSIIITEEDLCKKHAKKCAKICQFSSLPSKCFQAANDPNTKNDSKPHICAYNYNTRTGFRDHKKTWGPRVLSSTLMHLSTNQSPVLPGTRCPGTYSDTAPADSPWSWNRTCWRSRMRCTSSCRRTARGCSHTCPGLELSTNLRKVLQCTEDPF